MIGVDEAGRGPLLGRVYTAAVLLPDDFDVSLLKDSKKFTSEKKIKEVYAYIKQNAKYCITYKDETYIDKVNILNATIKSMQESVHGILNTYDLSDVKIYVDGTQFKPCFYKDKWIPYECVIKGDSLHKCISAASILAKVERDEYIRELCKQHPFLDERYGLFKNKGYGTKIHIEGIKTYGYCEYHRKSFKLKQLGTTH
jgi:ribonuclease HII